MILETHLNLNFIFVKQKLNSRTLLSFMNFSLWTGMTTTQVIGHHFLL